MDKKRTQRILGILVIIALVIILFPLLSEKNEQPTGDASNLNAPQFPDQHQASISEDTVTITPTQQSSTEIASNADETRQNAISKEAHAHSDATNLPVATTTSSNKTLTNKVSPSISMGMETKVTSISNINIKYPKLNIEQNRSSLKANDIQNQTQGVETVKEIPTTVSVTASNKLHVEKQPQHKTEKELAKLGSKAWAVQIGSFNNKSNAVRLVDKLRAAGYKAYTREVTTSSGKIQTRVYIGPEFQQASAKSLSAKLEQEIMMHGVIVSYQPLAL